MPPPPRIAAAKIDDQALHVRFADGRILSVPLDFFPTLQRATAVERKALRVETPWTLRWAKLDYDLGSEGLLTGARERADLPRLTPTLRRPRARLRRKTPLIA